MKQTKYEQTLLKREKKQRKRGKQKTPSKEEYLTNMNFQAGKRVFFL